MCLEVLRVWKDEGRGLRVDQGGERIEGLVSDFSSIALAVFSIDETGYRRTLITPRCRRPTLLFWHPYPSGATRMLTGQLAIRGVQLRL